MKFIALQTVQALDSQLTDGLSSLRYRELPDCFTRFEQAFLPYPLDPTDCVALEAENTLPAALTLLYLLEHECNVLLLPRSTLDGGALPSFCRYISTTRAMEKNAPEALEPIQFLNIREHKGWELGSWHGRAKLLLRTSGSTGTPKMAVHSYAKLHGNAANCVARFGLTFADRVAIPAPIYHMFGLGAAFLPSVMAGASVDLQKGANLLKFIQREQAFNPNVAFMTPSFCNTLLKVRKSRRPYRLTVSAGDRFRENQFENYERAFGCLVQLYGSTELGAIAAGAPDLPLEIRARSAGLPMPDAQLRIETTADKAEGNLWCKREYGFDGYVDNAGNPVDLEGEYVDGWFHTKDVAKLDSQGHLEVLGRSDHSVNRDGLLIFFADLEKAIESLDAVEAVAVVAGGETERGRKLIAYCVVDKNTQASAASIRTHCFEKLPRRAVPDEIRILEALPLLLNGKVDRVKLTNLTDIDSDDG